MKAKWKIHKTIAKAKENILLSSSMMELQAERARKLTQNQKRPLQNKTIQFLKVQQ